MSSNHVPAANPPSDAISAVKFSPNADSTKLLVASWDRKAYLYNVGRDETSTTQKASCSLINTFEHQAPLLDVCFGASDEEFYSAGLDWDVRHVNVNTAAQTVLSTHDAAVKAVVFNKEHNIVISASWDSTLHVHHLSSSSSTPAASSIIVPLPSKVFAMSATPTKVVVAMSSRLFHIYEVSKLAEAAMTASASTQDSTSPTSQRMELEPLQRREGSLKFMTRAVASMPTDLGYASSSIEGRVAVEWFDASSESQARKYAFKCHRQTQPATSIATASTENNNTNNNSHHTDSAEIDVVYPVNALSFHPTHGTFASGGGDGVVALWDGVAKRRIRQYPKYNSSVAAMAFSADGRFLAVGISPGFEDGREDDDEIAGGGSVAVHIRELGPTEAKGKEKVVKS